MTPTPFARSLPALPAVAGVVFAVALLLVLFACTGPGSQGAAPERSSEDPATEGAPTKTWQCSNDLEVRCGDGKCEAAGDGEFTPMSVTVSDSGAMSVCTYTGCWEGTGELVRSAEFLVLIGPVMTCRSPRLRMPRKT